MKRNLFARIAMLLSIMLVVSLIQPACTVDAAKGKKTSVTKVQITKPTKNVLTMKKGSTYQIKYKITPSTATNKKVSFTSSNKSVATVSKNGKITAVKAGTAKITVKSSNNKKDSVTVKVQKALVTSISLSPSSVTLTEGSSKALTTKIAPANADNKKVSYSSSNTKVAKVSSKGTVTAVKAGTATITVKALDGSGKKATCRVTVKKKAVKPTPKPTPKPTVKPSAKPSPSPSQPSEPEDEYKLVWSDDFDTFNLNDWNYECHEPGWVNNELQEYTNSSENIYAEDGKLVIKANKVGDKITSGKVTTQNKHAWKYGKFEISAKAVEGKGLWPAIWMMPTNENFYGQWPRCGEIDIMELLGHEPNKSYATIHYGNPHKEQQGTYNSPTSLADDFHVYGLEWEPSEMRFYVDGVLINKVNDWYTKTEGMDEITYPAPFDQEFYLQFNLAVGGNWPGNPDETTNFDNAKFMIDYVKVYQKDFYDENVTRPSKPPVSLRPAPADGNYIVNGDFSETEDLSDDIAWGEKYALDGVGKVTIDTEKNQMVIKTENQGTVDYSVQVVQPNIPMKKGGQYKVSFDAWADEARTMIVDVSAPDHSYIRYFNDTVVELGTASKHYEYTFTMTNDDDANGRLEYNLGNKGSTATVYIKNVRIEKIGQTEIKEPEKTIQIDGNYVYNGGFDKGADRLKYWTVNNKASSATVVATNSNLTRELKVEASGAVALDDILVSQDVAITGNKKYVLTFNARADKEKAIEARVAGNVFKADLTTAMKTYTFNFELGDTVADKNLVFALGNAGVTYIDNVRLAEDTLLINGDFTADFAAWEPFVDGGIASSVTYTVDSQKENQAAAFEIKDTGDMDWKIQLKQNGIKMEEGKAYKLTFDAKTTLPGGRKLLYAIQRDGSSDNDWTPYTGSKVVEVKNDWSNYELSFLMSCKTDLRSILSFSMGAVEGKQIKTTHSMYIDNVTLEEIDPSSIRVEVEEVEGNMIKNADFASADGAFANWEQVLCESGAAEFSAVEGGFKAQITNVGNQDYAVQLKQKINGLITGHKYNLKMKVNSDKARTVKVALLNEVYDWYGGTDIILAAGEEKSVDITIDVSKATSNQITFGISMGKIANEDTQPGDITITDIWLEDVTNK